MLPGAEWRAVLAQLAGVRSISRYRTLFAALVGVVATVCCVLLTFDAPRGDIGAYVAIAITGEASEDGGDATLLHVRSDDGSDGTPRHVRSDDGSDGTTTDVHTPRSSTGTPHGTDV